MIKILQKNIKSIILVLLVCLCLFLIYDKKSKESFKEHCKKSKFMFLYIDGCKYCDDLKEIWKTSGLPGELQNEVKEHHSLKDKVKLLSYKDNEIEHKQRVHHVRKSGGYPTLLLEKCDGSTKLYNGTRDTKSLISWLSKNA
jgi:thioredoxin-related protein